MKVYSFNCASCGYEEKFPLGSSDLDQTLTDVNTDYAVYRLFLCKKESKLFTSNIHDRSFDGKCPSDASELQEIDPKEAKCPRCSNPLQSIETKPLATSDTSAE